MGYLKDTLKGFGWMGGFRVASRGVAFVRTAVLARLLTPAQFGVYGIGVIALALLEMLTETGINIFLIQEEEGIEKYLGTARVVSIVRGVIIALFIFSLAPLVEKFFDIPGSSEILKLISLVPFVRGFINPSLVRLQKELSFSREFAYRMSTFTFDSVVAVLTALIIKSPLALVWGLLAGSILEVILTNVFIKPFALPKFEFLRFKTITRRGKWVTGAGIFDYLAKQGDNMVVGKLLGAAPLGLYQMAYSLSTLPITEVSDVAGKVTFPVFVRISGDIQRLKAAYLKSLGGITALVVPIGLVLFLFPHLVIEIVLGSQWLGAVEALRVLAIFGILRALSGTTGSLFFSLKKQEYVTNIMFVRFVALAVTIIPLTMKYGIIGAGYSALLSAIAAIPVIIYYLTRTLFVR